MYPAGNLREVPEPRKDDRRSALVDLTQLIDAIVVHPESKPYLKKTLKHLLDIHGLDPELVAESSLKSKSDD